MQSEEEREREKGSEDGVCQVTSQATPRCDISLGGKVHVQGRDQLRQIGKVSRLGGQGSRLIEGLVDQEDGVVD